MPMMAKPMAKDGAAAGVSRRTMAGTGAPAPATISVTANANAASVEASSLCAYPLMCPSPTASPLIIGRRRAIALGIWRSEIPEGERH